MASVFGHAAVALSGTAFFSKDINTKKVALIGVVCSILPDIDVLSFRFGIPYEHWLGHRGLTHSILFAIVLSLIVVLIFHLKNKKFAGLWLYYFICTVSHGVLDAFTNGGRGTGFFIPFNMDRFFFPTRPILVSPLGIENFFSEWGLKVLASELLWIILPSLIVYTMVRSVRNFGA